MVFGRRIEVLSRGNSLMVASFFFFFRNLFFQEFIIEYHCGMFRFFGSVSLMLCRMLIECFGGLQASQTSFGVMGAPIFQIIFRGL